MRSIIAISALALLLPALAKAKTANVLVILVQWANHGDRKLISQAEINQMWNGPGYDSVVTGESIAEYFNSNSYGQLEIQADVIDWYKVAQTEEEASNGNMGNSLNGKDIEDVLIPALEAAVANNGVDLSKYADDNNNLRGVAFIHSGYAAESYLPDCETEARYQDRIISKSWGMNEPIGNTGYNIISFITASAYWGRCNLNINRVGVPIHEWLHSQYGVPDLYDTKGPYMNSRVSRGGIGGFGVMSSPGGMRAYGQEAPGLISPWMKMEIGILEPIEITHDGTFTCRSAARYPDIYIIKEGYKNGEFLLIENRQPELSDINIRGSGIVIWHVDENIGGYGNNVRGGPFLAGWPGNGAHYKVAVLQKDGLYDLEMAINLGDTGDFWGTGDVLGPGNGETVYSSSGTYPNTDSYVDGDIVVTGITIDGFTEIEAGVWNFTVSGLGTKPPSAPSTPVGPSETPGGQPTSAPGGPSETPDQPTLAPVGPAETPGAQPTSAPSSGSVPSITVVTMLTYVLAIAMLATM